MRIILKSLLFISLWITFSSCEENFSPVVDYRQTYALSCIIRGDTSFQVATLFSSYDLENGDPSQNPAYDGAEVRLWYRDTVYWFKDSLISYNTYSDSTLKFYYLDNFRPATGGELLEIEAMLKNGKRLKGSCVTPSSLQFNTKETSKVIPPINSAGILFQWMTEDEISGFFVGRLRIQYLQKIDGEYQLKYKEVPVSYTDAGGRSIPVFPSPSKSASIIYDSSAVTKALQEIAENDSHKSDYRIYQNAVFEVLALDENASRYYSSTLQDNSFTVDVNELDYTNIEGGFGIFGSIVSEEITIRFVPEYITSFGYEIFFED